MSNTFDLTIKHNLHVGMQNAINQIAHLENLIGIADGKAAFSDTSRYVIKELERLQESLSLIEPEGEHWIEVRGGNYPTPEQAKSGIIVNEKGGHIYSWGLHDATAEGIEAYFKMEQFTHWCHKPAPPVTLSEASNHSFQQAVEVPAHPKVQAFGDFLGSFDTTNNQ